MKSREITIVLAVLFCLMALSQQTRAGEWTSGTATAPSGTRNYKLWVPAKVKPDKPVPLVMMLHGCMQKPEDLAVISGMNNVADQAGFLVVYPEQTKAANALNCWNWFDPSHQRRDAGEPAILAAVIAQVKSTNRIDERRVYVAGISAGAAMAVVMGVAYPDLFSAIGASAGLEYQAAVNAQAGLTAMKSGGPNPVEQGIGAAKLMAEHFPKGAKPRMPVIIFQGDADPYVDPLNADQLIAQWAAINDLLDDGKSDGSVKSTSAKTADGEVPGGHKYTRTIYHDHHGNGLMEKWLVKGLGHAWSGSPAAAPFADPKGPNASEQMWRFFSATSLAQGKTR
ncbi:MAG: PHB depolymerase family esterase [Pyrinomonadaceae bacterium]